jgi:uncharacterized protein
MSEEHTNIWDDLGDLEAGRPNLGKEVPVLVYRLMHFTLRDSLMSELGPARATELLQMAGKLAGLNFCRNMLDLKLELNEFIAQLQRVLREQKIGILRVEYLDLDKMEIIVTIAEDLECSGLAASDETVCDYDEGFLAGVMEAYTGKPFAAKEVDCWASGDRVCRFVVRSKRE